MGRPACLLWLMTCFAQSGHLTRPQKGPGAPSQGRALTITSFPSSHTRGLGPIVELGRVQGTLGMCQLGHTGVLSNSGGCSWGQ